MEEKDMELVTGEAEPIEVAEEQAKSIAKMYEDMDAKVLSAQARLVQQLDVTSEKYRTANGVMSALDTLRTVYRDKDRSITAEILDAKKLAKFMAKAADEMAKKAEEADPEDFGSLCDGFYDEAFCDELSLEPGDLAKQLMLLQLCQNVGPSAGDIVDFIATAKQEIEKARDILRTFCEENGLDFDEICNEK